MNLNLMMGELPRALQLMLATDEPLEPSSLTDLPRRSILKIGAAGGFALADAKVFAERITPSRM